MDKFHHAIKKHKRKSSTKESDFGLSIMVPVECQHCSVNFIPLFKVALEQCVKQDKWLHIEIDSTLARNAILSTSMQYRAHLVGYSIANDLNEYSSLYGRGMEYELLNIGQILFTGQMATFRDKSLLDSASAVALVDCEHQIYRSLICQIPAEVTVGVYAPGYTTQMLARLSGQVSEHNRLVFEKTGAGLIKKLLKSM